MRDIYHTGLPNLHALEIAAYTSLIAMAEQVGDTAAIPLLKQSLAEEQAMAKFIEQAIVPPTQKYCRWRRLGTRPASSQIGELRLPF